MKMLSDDLLRRHLLLINGDPIGGGEPSVQLDVIDSILQVAVSGGCVRVKSDF